MQQDHPIPTFCQYSFELQLRSSHDRYLTVCLELFSRGSSVIPRPSKVRAW